jgi:hypothetical protein
MTIKEEFLLLLWAINNIVVMEEEWRNIMAQIQKNQFSHPLIFGTLDSMLHFSKINFPCLPYMVN